MHKLAALTERADVAEADAAKLQKALAAANAARATVAPPARVLADSRDEAKAAMIRAIKLEQEGKFKEALDAYLKSYRDLAGKHGPLDQQSVTSRLASLGAKYPPALLALRDLRDAAMKNLQANPGTRELVSEIGILNELMGDGAASMALYDTLPPGDLGRQALASIAHNSFVEARRYADALVGKTYGSMLNDLEMGVRSSTRATSPSSASERAGVINGTLTAIEALTGAGKLDDAHLLTEKLLAFDGSDATRAAIKQHVDRASQPLSPP